MKIKFNETVELEVVNAVNELDDTFDSNIEVFTEGLIMDIDIFGENPEMDTIDFQFGDGSVVYSVQRSLITFSN